MRIPYDTYVTLVVEMFCELLSKNNKATNAKQTSARIKIVGRYSNFGGAVVTH